MIVGAFTSNQPHTAMSELPLSETPRWTVRTKYHPQTKQEKELKMEPKVKCHELLYGNRLQTTRKGESGQAALMDLAKFLNAKRMEPRDRIECAADAPNPEKYLQKISGIKA